MSQEIVKSSAVPSEKPDYRRTVREREELFARNWVIDQNNSRSYRAAGYKCGSDEVAGAGGARLLTRVRVKRLIDRLLASRASRLEVRADRVLEELQVIAYSNLQDYIQVLEDGSIAIDLSRATPEQMRAVQEVVIDEYMEDGDNPRRVKKTKFKLHSKFPALEKLYQHAVPRTLDHIGRDGGTPTVIIIDIPRPGGGEPAAITVTPSNGNGHNGNGSHS